MRRIAIVGSSSASIERAPFDDKSFEIWGLPQMIDRSDRVFEMHEDKFINTAKRSALINSKVPVIMSYERDDIPMSRSYPHDAVRRVIGSEYFASSIAYMIALAIYEHDLKDGEIEYLGIYGVDLSTGSEYEHQRPNAEYLLGLAKGSGIQIIIPDESALLKVNYVYGKTDKPETAGAIDLDFIDSRINLWDERLKIYKQEFDRATGAKMEALYIKENIEAYMRGFISPKTYTKKES